MKVKFIPLYLLALCLCLACQSNASEALKNGNHEDLLALFSDWRSFENPPKLNNAPDYSASTFDARWDDFLNLRSRLDKMDTTDWKINQKVDWMVVWAEMNGYEFNYKTLKPWVRDPAYYKSIWMARSDVPAHEGPTHHGTTEVWTYNFPLDQSQRAKFISDLAVIPSLNTQAQQNLTGNAKDLWITGIRDIRTQSYNLAGLKNLPGVAQDSEIISAIDEAITSTNDFVSWLEDESASKSGPSGIGKEAYSWYLQNVHLVPMTWEDEVMLLKTELAGAWSALKLEEHKNKGLPELKAADSPKAYDKLADEAATNLMQFLKEKDIVTVKDYFEPALREHLGSFVPEDKRNFFLIGEHYDPRPLYSHFYHWFELAIMDNEPHKSAVRKGPVLYNIYDSRNEGMATAVEELFMDAGLYEDSPRSREIVYIMIAQRAARGLGSLYAHANEMTMEEAGGIHSEYTPRGWMKTEKELLIFEQHLYLRQPGYGTSYITGKHLVKNALAEFAKTKEATGQPFEIKEFFDRMNAIGSVPTALGHWELTGINPLDYLSRSLSKD